MNDPAAGIERLRQLYDPAYVRQVDAPAGAPVQVCLEARMLEGSDGTGVATYARTLAHCLPRAGAGLLVLSDAAARRPARRSRLRRWVAAMRTGSRLAMPSQEGPGGASQHWIATDLFREAQVFFNLHGRLLPVEFMCPPQVMHWTYPLPLYVRGARNLYTVHDIIPLTDPGVTGIRQGRHRAILSAIAARAHRLVTVTEAVRLQVIDHLHVAPERVANTLQGVAAPVQADPKLPAPLRPGRYFFFCGRVEARKNLDRLVAAHAASGTDLPLVVVGPSVAGEERLEARLRAAPGVIRLGWAPRHELLGMMRCARALLFPSLAEGFGLPIAESMTLGCPVLASTIPAAIEVAGDAALYVDPLDGAAIERAIRELDADDLLCARLRADGFARSRVFGIDQYARRLSALYADALAAPSLADAAA